MFGARFRLSELLLMVILCGIAMFGIIMYVKNTFPGQQTKLFEGAFFALFTAGVLLWGCVRGLSWVTRLKLEKSWQRIGGMLAGAFLAPSIVGLIACLGGILSNWYLLGFFAVCFAGLALEKEARQAEGWKSVQPGPVVMRAKNQVWTVLPPAYQVPPEEEPPESPDSDPPQSSQKA